MSLVLKNAQKSDIEIIEEILKKESLPYQDVNFENIKFYKAFDNTNFIGIVGLEKFTDVALLRSMVVLNEFKKMGYGREICKTLKNLAKIEKINELYLLTTTAKTFFERLGFKIITRKNVPDSIKSTTEFSTLCPDTAICMHINL